VLLAGGGAIGAAAESGPPCRTLDAPVVMTVNGRGVLPPGHPLAVPYSPSLAPVRALIAAADVVLAVGTEIGPTDYDMYGLRAFPPPARLLRIDIERRSDAAQCRARSRLDRRRASDAGGDSGG